MRAARRRFSMVLVLFSLFGAAPAPALADDAAGYLQGLLGAGKFDRDSLTFTVPSAAAADEEDLSSMPFVGLFGQYLFPGGATRLGVEGGALFGWRSRKTAVLLSDTRAVVKIDSSFWMLDLSAGISLQLDAGRRWRLYLGVGPAMVFAEYEEEGELEEGDAVDPATTEAVEGSSTSEFGIGGYARAGIEYEYSPTSLIGISLRGLATNLEFDNAAGASAVNGLQGFVTFTRRFPGY